MRIVSRTNKRGKGLRKGKNYDILRKIKEPEWERKNVRGKRIILQLIFEK
jgi:hypothetical protein